MEQIGAHNGDDAWIEKYRDALQNPPVEKKRFEELRKMLEGLRKAISTYVKKISVHAEESSKESGKTVSVPASVETSGKKESRKRLQVPVKKSAQRKAG